MIRTSPFQDGKRVRVFFFFRFTFLDDATPSILPPTLPHQPTKKKKAKETKTNRETNRGKKR